MGTPRRRRTVLTVTIPSLAVDSLPLLEDTLRRYPDAEWALKDGALVVTTATAPTPTSA